MATNFSNLKFYIRYGWDLKGQLTKVLLWLLRNLVQSWLSFWFKYLNQSGRKEKETPALRCLTHAALQPTNLRLARNLLLSAGSEVRGSIVDDSPLMAVSRRWPSRAEVAPPLSDRPPKYDREWSIPSESDIRS